MSKLVLIARILLGLIFTVFGLNGFLHFIPLPEMTGSAATFMGGLAAAGYFFPLLKVVEILSGLMLLAGRFVPLALTLLASIVLNIFLYHVTLDSSGLPMAVAVLVLEIFLAWSYRSSFSGVLNANAQPG